MSALEPEVAAASLDPAAVARVVGCLRAAYQDNLGMPLPLSDAEIVGQSLREIGMDSAAMLAFIVAVEDEFGIEWSDEVPVEALSSVLTIARFVQDELAPA